MSGDFIDLLGEAEEAIDFQSDPFEISDFPQSLVTEKIIFVIDYILLVDVSGKACNIYNMLSILNSHINLKKQTCVKPPQFECLMYNKNAILHYTINSEKNLSDAFLSIKNVEYDGDEEPLKINEVFDKIADLVELLDPDCIKNCLPPDYVYHVIWLFGRNLNIPTMQSTNSFDFLMMTPYLALDILYIYDQRLSDNQCDQISNALQGLNENRRGYFLSCSAYNKRGLFASFAQLLGHPLIRIPQERARYNIVDLYNKLEGEINIKNNNNEEQ